MSVESTENRRGFMTAALAVIVGAVVGTVPLLAAVFMFLDPLRKKPVSRVVRVALASDVPEDGSPKQFTVFGDREDAWNRFTNQPIGAVYLRKLSDGQIEALKVVCPHAGCFVSAQGGVYICPCHNSSFNYDGSRTDPEASPAARDLDTLAVEIRNGNEIWIDFKNFRAGTPEKIAT